MKTASWPTEESAPSSHSFIVLYQLKTRAKTDGMMRPPGRRVFLI
jgi:hypothetical protein